MKERAKKSESGDNKDKGERLKCRLLKVPRESQQ